MHEDGLSPNLLQEATTSTESFDNSHSFLGFFQLYENSSNGSSHFHVRLPLVRHLLHSNLPPCNELALSPCIVFSSHGGVERFRLYSRLLVLSIDSSAVLNAAPAPSRPIDPSLSPSVMVRRLHEVERRQHKGVRVLKFALHGHSSSSSYFFTFCSQRLHLSHFSRPPTLISNARFLPATPTRSHGCRTGVDTFAVILLQESPPSWQSSTSSFGGSGLSISSSPPRINRSCLPVALGPSLETSDSPLIMLK